MKDTFKLMGIWKLLAAPVAIPAALTLVVALAGPGGVFEPHQTPGGNADAPFGTTAGIGASNPPAIGGVANADPLASDLPGDGHDDVAPASGSLEGPGCVEALTEQAASRPELEAHVAGQDAPAGGADGNQNALDSQCDGAFASDTSGESSQGGASSGGSVPSDAGPPADSGRGGGAAGNANGNAGGQGNAGGKPQDQ